jgi:hypothetical protein
MNIFINASYDQHNGPMGSLENAARILVPFNGLRTKYPQLIHLIHGMVDEKSVDLQIGKK